MTENEIGSSGYKMGMIWLLHMRTLHKHKIHIVGKLKELTNSTKQSPVSEAKSPSSIQETPWI
jgi:hypothetical protein